MIFGIFVVLQLILIWNGGPAKIFESPDATINYHFAYRLATGQPLGLPVTIPVAGEYVTPRSAVVRGGYLLPAGFVGLIAFYGFLSSLTSTVLLPYWTLLFALLGLLHFYWLIKKVFSPQMAWWSVLVAMFHPAWLYYTQRSLLPNVLFVSLLLMASYYLYQISQRRRWWDYALLGVTLSGAIIVRPSESVWILAAVATFIVIEWRRLFAKYILLAALGVIPVVLVALLAVVDHWSVLWGGGNQIISTGPTSIFYLVSALLFPFGFHPRLILWVVEQYVVWWQFPFLLLALVGALSLRHNFKEQRHRRYGWLTLFVGIFLLCYYGSWALQDNPEPGAVTIGTSYVRYLLPLYILLAPYVAWAIIGLSRQLLPRYQKLFIVSIVLTLGLFSFQRVMLEPQEGWWQQRRDLQVYTRTLERVKAIIPADSIIMTQKADKYLWPTYAVVTPQGDSGYLEATAALVRAGWPVYFLNPQVTSERRDYFNQQWNNYGLRLGPPLFEAENLGLYQLELIHD
ncbi:MAG: glycosyltransferase family 39 protein [Candidatus Komeilibacteria bacterium]